MMNKKKYTTVLIIGLSIFSIILSVIIVLLFTHRFASDQYYALSSITEYITSRHPEEEQELLRLIKKSTLQNPKYNNTNAFILSSHGYTLQTFKYRYSNIGLSYIALMSPLLLLLISLFVIMIRKGYKTRIQSLTKYLEQINQDKAPVLTTHKEDDFSLLEDEMYKTITMLRQTREEAVKEQSNLADSLADISHQIKTPLTSISIMVQLLSKEQNNSYTDCIKKQTVHMERLVEALITLARIDAGVIKLNYQEVNTYTMLQLSVEELEAVILEKNIKLSLPNYPELYYTGDMDWSIEAFSNLIKNCVEHTPNGGSIKLDYFQNPLYMQIQIEDSGEGFSKKDLPHIFERFYRGEKPAEGGTGIGLALAKALIEQQNGAISAENLPDKGACFIIRFYCH